MNKKLLMWLSILIGVIGSVIFASILLSVTQAEFWAFMLLAVGAWLLVCITASLAWNVMDRLNVPTQAPVIYIPEVDNAPLPRMRFVDTEGNIIRDVDEVVDLTLGVTDEAVHDPAADDPITTVFEE